MERQSDRIVKFCFFLTQVRASYVVALAGDVHYGFTIRALFRPLISPQGVPEFRNGLPVIQLTSSSAKNSAGAWAIALADFIQGSLPRSSTRYGWIQRPRFDLLSSPAPSPPDTLEIWSKLEPPVLLPETDVRRLGITDSPDWREDREYEPMYQGRGNDQAGLVWDYVNPTQMERPRCFWGETNYGEVFFRPPDSIFHTLVHPVDLAEVENGGEVVFATAFRIQP